MFKRLDDGGGASIGLKVDGTAIRARTGDTVAGAGADRLAVDLELNRLACVTQPLEHGTSAR